MAGSVVCVFKYLSAGGIFQIWIRDSRFPEEQPVHGGAPYADIINSVCSKRSGYFSDAAGICISDRIAGSSGIRQFLRFGKSISKIYDENRGWRESAMVLGVKNDEKKKVKEKIQDILTERKNGCIVYS